MKPDRIKALLPLINSKCHGERTGWVLAMCPFSWRHDSNGSKAFAVSTDPKKKSRVKCLSCGYSGDLMDLLLHLQFELRKVPEYRSRFNFAVAVGMVTSEFEEMELTAADIPEFEDEPVKTELLFPEQWLQSFKSISLFPEGLNYCINRGLSFGILKKLDVRFDPQQRRVCFPFRNFKGELMGVQGRAIDKSNALRYFQYGYKGHRNMHIWMGEDKVNLDMVVIPCEGPFDFAKIAMVYPNVVASFTSGISRTKARRIGDADSVLTFYDFGQGGTAARNALEKYLPHHPMMHCIPDESEGDPGAMTTEDIREAIKDHVELP